MKQFKRVIITAIVLVVVAAAAFATIKLLPEDNSIENYQPTNPSDVSSGLNKIVDRSSKDVASVEVTADDGETFTIEYGEDSIGAQTAVMKNADPSLRYSESDMTTLSGFVGLLVALEEVGELKSGEEALYGFDNPQRIIKVNFKGGDPVTLIIGKATPLGTDGVYLRRADRNIVYTVGGSTTQILLMKMSDYRDYTLFDPIASADLLSKVTLSRPGKEDIVVVRKADADEAPADETEAMLKSSYELISPVQRDANVDNINSALLDKVIAIKGVSVVEDYPKDIAKYGLNNPTKLKFETTTGQSVSLLIGARTPEGGRYVMPEGAPTVIATESDIDLDNLNYADIIMQLLWFYNSEDISSIDYELPGENHRMTLEVTDNSIVGKFDGAEMQNKNATNLFLRTVRFTIGGEYTSDMKVGERAIRATITLRTGKKTTLELFPINERQYAASVDGAAPRYYVGVDEVSELLESFEIIKKGEDIPDMF